MGLFKSRDIVLQEMFDDYKDITGITLSLSNIELEEVVKMMTYAGAISSFYADLNKAYNAIHPQTSSMDDLLKHLDSRQLPGRAEPQRSYGNIKHTGLEGKSLNIGTRVRRKLDGRLFESTEGGVFGASGELILNYRSVLKGQENNIEEADQDFELVTAIADVDTLAVSTTKFSNARNQETPTEVLVRVEEHDRRENTGGNIPAYEKWAKEASDQVVTATSYKHARGVSTVDTIITSGTSDIEAAVDNDQPVSRIPTVELVAEVQAYIITQNPTTDDHQTFAPEEEDFNTTIHFELHDESLRPTVEFEITKIWKKFVYNVKPSTRIYPFTLETQIDAKLKSLIKTRRVSDFTVNGYYQVPDRTLLAPGVLTFTGGA